MIAVTLFATACAITFAVVRLVARFPHAPPGVPPEMVPAAWAEYAVEVAPKADGEETAVSEIEIIDTVNEAENADTPITE